MLLYCSPQRVCPGALQHCELGNAPGSLGFPVRDALVLQEAAAPGAMGSPLGELGEGGSTLCSVPRKHCCLLGAVCNSATEEELVKMKLKVKQLLKCPSGMPRVVNVGRIPVHSWQEV